MLQTVERFLDPWEAHIVCARLNADGIPATVAFANHAIIDWPAALALGGTAVQVPEEHLAQARRIAAEYRAGELEADLPEEPELQEGCCPECGSGPVRQVAPLRQRLLAGLLGIFGATFPTRESEMVCDNCGARWEA
ncbi:putative signal transducing protein [Cognatiluteimonas lumbrici]|uniref:DUF2007 domain-containing protein n=1 Tax=Cognatiluteimonas lumbrici TaxID=2559601 RepID=UPI001126ADD4|nr:DUF2007 domain-containing protein [Luteimonas lumbrici]